MPMVAIGRSSAKFGVWDQISSGVGYHLDNLGRRLIEGAPKIGALYATLLAPRVPRPRPEPGWRFAGEYYEQRRWMACRRGALWEAAKKLDPALHLLMPLRERPAWRQIRRIVADHEWLERVTAPGHGANTLRTKPDQIFTGIARDRRHRDPARHLGDPGELGKIEA